MTDKATVELWLLDSVYKLGCPPDRQKELRTAGEHLEQKFKDLRSSNPRMDNQKIAVMVGLQIMQELLDLNKTLQQYNESEHVLLELIDNVDQQVKSLIK